MILTRIQTVVLSGVLMVALLIAVPLNGAVALDMEPDTSGDGQTVPDPRDLDRGRDLYFEGNYQGAYDAWKPLADAGNARALYNLSTLYRRGYGTDKDVAKATELLLSSAEKGFPDAQYLYATTIFDDANDDEAQKQEAVRWWLTAARQGNGLSQYRLGLLYWNGVAVARDLVRGHAWMGLASQAGIAEAQDALKSMDRYLDDGQREDARLLAARLLDEGKQPRLQSLVEQPKSVSPKKQDMSSPESIRQSKSEAKKPAKPVQTAAVADQSAPPSSRQKKADFDKSWRLQMVALKDAGEVEKEWKRLVSTAPDLLEGLDHRVIPAHLGDRGTFYRLYIGPFNSRDVANSRCQALKAAGMGCFIVAPNG